MDVFELDIADAEFKETELYKAIVAGRPPCVLEAIRSGCGVHARDPEYGTSYLHLAVSSTSAEAEHRLTPIIYQLSNAGVDVDAVQRRGQTALELAIERRLPRAVEALLRVGASTTARDYGAMVGALTGPRRDEVRDAFARYQPGLWEAVSAADCGAVHLLVNSWCRINVARAGRHLLDVARQAGHADLVAILDDFQVTIEFVHATLAGDEERMLEFLMDSRPCDPFIMDIGHLAAGAATPTPRSLRDAAIALGHLHTLDYLPEDDPDVDVDVKGHLGGLTLADAVLASRTDDQRAEVAPPSGRAKFGPMKALIPYPGSAEPRTPDVIAEHAPRERALFARQLDLLADDCRLTGSVSLRARPSKSRRSPISAYSVEEPTTCSQDCRPRDAIPLYGTNFVIRSHWKRSSSLRSSTGHSKSRSKEIISKMCVIS